MSVRVSGHSGRVPPPPHGTDVEAQAGSQLAERQHFGWGSRLPVQSHHRSTTLLGRILLILLENSSLLLSVGRIRAFDKRGAKRCLHSREGVSWGCTKGNVCGEGGLAVLEQLGDYVGSSLQLIQVWGAGRGDGGGSHGTPPSPPDNLAFKIKLLSLPAFLFFSLFL